MKKTILVILALLPYFIQSQTFDGNLGSQSLNWSTEQKDFNAPPRVNVPPMSIKLWDNYRGVDAPGDYGSLLEISGRYGHLVSQLYFNSILETGRIQYRSAFYGETTWGSWRYLLDSKSDVESSGNLKITGIGNSYIIGGNLGIGTANPRANLDVANYIPNEQIGTVFGRLGEGDNVGSGTFLGVQGYATQGSDWYNVKSFSIVHNFYGKTNNSINFYRGLGETGGFLTFCTDNNVEKMRILGNGNVGIGTTNPTSKLTVAGNILAREVKVTVDAGADFVFEKEYNLPSLDSVDKYIKENNHLPEIASAEEMKKDGINLSEMNIKLLKKIEELTLYTIEQNKEIKKLKEEKDILKTLSDRLSKVESQLQNK